MSDGYEFGNIVFKIVIDAYKHIRSKNLIIPSVRGIMSQIKFDIDAKAYDYIYGIKHGDILEEHIFNVLMNNKISFIHDGNFYNDPQTVLFEIDKKE